MTELELTKMQLNMAKANIKFFNELLDEERICMHGDKFYPEVIK